MSSPSSPNFYDILKEKMAGLTQPEPEEVPPQFPLEQSRFFKSALSFYEKMCKVTEKIRKAVKETEFPEQYKAFHRCPFCKSRYTIKTVSRARANYWYFGNYGTHLKKVHPEKLKLRQLVSDDDSELESVQEETLNVASVETLASDGDAIDEIVKEIAVENDEVFMEDEIPYAEGAIVYEPDQLIEEVQLTSHDVTVFTVFKEGFSINGGPVTKFNENVVLDRPVQVVRMEVGR